MVEKHSRYEWPPDDTVIWRYLDFTKFVEMVSSKSLFFSRADKFQDPFEGSLLKKTLERRLKLKIPERTREEIIYPFPYNR
jgi:hypothetical protein